MFLDDTGMLHIRYEQWLFLEAGIMYDFNFTIHVFLYVLIFLLKMKI